MSPNNNPFGNDGTFMFASVGENQSQSNNGQNPDFPLFNETQNGLSSTATSTGFESFSFNSNNTDQMTSPNSSQKFKYSSNRMKDDEIETIVGQIDHQQLLSDVTAYAQNSLASDGSSESDNDEIDMGSSLELSSTQMQIRQNIQMYKLETKSSKKCSSNKQNSNEMKQEEENFMKLDETKEDVKNVLNPLKMKYDDKAKYFIPRSIDEMKMEVESQKHNKVDHEKALKELECRICRVKNIIKNGNKFIDCSINLILQSLDILHLGPIAIKSLNDETDFDSFEDNVKNIPVILKKVFEKFTEMFSLILYENGNPTLYKHAYQTFDLTHLFNYCCGQEYAVAPADPKDVGNRSCVDTIKQLKANFDIGYIETRKGEIEMETLMEKIIDNQEILRNVDQQGKILNRVIFTYLISVRNMMKQDQNELLQKVKKIEDLNHLTLLKIYTIQFMEIIGQLSTIYSNIEQYAQIIHSSRELLKKNKTELDFNPVDAFWEEILNRDVVKLSCEEEKTEIQGDDIHSNICSTTICINKYQVINGSINRMVEYLMNENAKEGYTEQFLNGIEEFSDHKTVIDLLITQFMVPDEFVPKYPSAKQSEIKEIQKRALKAIKRFIEISSKNCPIILLEYLKDCLNMWTHIHYFDRSIDEIIEHKKIDENKLQMTYLDLQLEEEGSNTTFYSPIFEFILNCTNENENFEKHLYYTDILTLNELRDSEFGILKFQDNGGIAPTFKRLLTRNNYLSNMVKTMYFCCDDYKYKLFIARRFSQIASNLEEHYGDNQSSYAIAVILSEMLTFVTTPYIKSDGTCEETKKQVVDELQQIRKSMEVLQSQLLQSTRVIIPSITEFLIKDTNKTIMQETSPFETVDNEKRISMVRIEFLDYFQKKFTQQIQKAKRESSEMSIGLITPLLTDYLSVLPNLKFI